MYKRAYLMLVMTAGVITSFQHSANCQKDSIPLKNTIHYNLTSPIIFGVKTIIFGYERVLNNRRSFTVNVGSTTFPSLGIIDADSIQAKTIRDDVGFHFSADYRFYLARENKYVAPRGVYIAPYYAFNQFKKDHTWLLTSTSGGVAEVNSNVRLNVHTIGVELGYQFIFWDRFTVDMILLGPGIAAYDLKATIGSNLSTADKERLLDAINSALEEKFPGYSLVIDDTEFKRTGAKSTTSLGYRYLIQIGFRF